MIALPYSYHTSISLTSLPGDKRQIINHCLAILHFLLFQMCLQNNKMINRLRKTIWKEKQHWLNTSTLSTWFHEIKKSISIFFKFSISKINRIQLSLHWWWPNCHQNNFIGTIYKFATRTSHIYALRTMFNCQS